MEGSEGCQSKWKKAELLLMEKRDNKNIQASKQNVEVSERSVQTFNELKVPQNVHFKNRYHI